mgnify:CR=1 FL=1
MTLLLQLAPTLILRDTETLITNISQSFSQITRDLLINPGIFTALVNYALILTLGAFGYFLVQWIRKMISGQEVVSQLAWPIVCFFLLSGSGSPLANICLGSQELVNTITQGVLQQTINGVQLQQSLQQALARGSAEQMTAVFERLCASEPEGRREQCRQEQAERLNAKLEETQQGTFWDYFSLENIKQSIVGQLTLTIEMGLVATVAYTIATVMVWTLEIALIVLLVTSPIAVGLSLLPVPGRPVLVWMSSFIGLSMAKIGLIAANAIASSVVVSAEANLNTILLPLFMAVGSPAIAITLALVSGGGAFLSIAGSPMAIALPLVGMGRQLMSRGRI